MTHSALRRFWNKRSSGPGGPLVVGKIGAESLPGKVGSLPRYVLNTVDCPGIGPYLGSFTWADVGGKEVGAAYTAVLARKSSMGLEACMIKAA